VAADLPRKFNVSLLKDTAFGPGVWGSKCSGEPPLALATSVAMAVRAAIHSARNDAGHNEFVPIHAPMTIDIVQTAFAPDALSLNAKTAKPLPQDAKKD
jgi:xanthine dehydrogenase molybdopterin-binding subunit B